MFVLFVEITGYGPPLKRPYPKEPKELTPEEMEKLRQILNNWGR